MSHKGEFGFHVKPIDRTLTPALQEKIDNLNKPKGSLGRLETLALQLGLIQQTLSPTLLSPQHLLLAADHGIEREGVSASPREVTWQQVENFRRGGGGVNLFCRQHHFRLRIVDTGVDHLFPTQHTSDDLNAPADRIINRKTAPHGTRNFLHEPAMTEQEMTHTLQTGALLADACHDEGANVLCLGEMGIANTSPSSVWMHLFLDIPLDQCVGAGSGLSTQAQQHKLGVLKAAIKQFTRRTGIESSTPLDTPPGWAAPQQQHRYQRPYFPAFAAEIIQWFGGYEMVAAIGAMLRAAELHMTILVDGFIMTACLLAACQLCPATKQYAVFGHQGDEQGHALMLRVMGAWPLLHLGMRLGEGTGALCAWPLLQSAVAMLNEMDNFQHAGITKYF